MARTAITEQVVLNSGLNPTYGAGDAVNHHQFVNDGRQILHVKNGGGSPINVTISTNAKVAGITVPSVVIAVTNAQDRFIGPFDPGVFNQSGGLVYADLSAATSVTLAVLRVGL